MKRVLSLAMIMLLAFTLFAGCGDSKDKSTESDSAATDKAFNISYLDAEGTSVYEIIRPLGDQAAMKASQSLFKSMKEALGTNVKMAFDDASDGVDSYEVLVGNTNRPESNEAKKLLVEKTTGRYNDYIITVIGKKIVVYGESDTALNSAVDYFIANFLKKEGTAIELYAYADNTQYPASYTVNGVNLGQFDFVRPHFNSSYLTELEMESVMESVLTETGYKMDILHDTYTAEAPSEYEIIVGDTTREGVEKLTDYDSFKIKVSGKKVYINGGSAHATAVGVSEFFKLIKSGNLTDNEISGSYATAIASYDDKVTFKKTWGDDFDSISLDQSKWRQENETNRNDGMNGKSSIRSTNPSDVFIHDGSFYICAREDETYYYGGMIKTEKTMNYKYGYLEASMLLPHGDGFWIALWACSNDTTSSLGSGPKLTSPEIDIVECFGNSNWYAANCHAWPTDYGSENYGYEHVSLDGKYGNDKKYQSPDTGVKLGDGFHTYGFLWDETQMAFVCDGKLFFSYQTNTSEHDIEAYNHNMFLIFSMATGFATQNKITSNPDEWANTNKLAMDWVNIYQKNDGVSELNILS